LPKDERLDRKSKLIDSFEISHEHGTDNENMSKQQIMAHATVFARNLANERGSVATPCYMEEKVRALCDENKDLVKEMRVVKGQ